MSSSPNPFLERSFGGRWIRCGIFKSKSISFLNRDVFDTLMAWINVLTLLNIWLKEFICIQLPKCVFRAWGEVAVVTRGPLSFCLVLALFLLMCEHFKKDVDWLTGGKDSD